MLGAITVALLTGRLVALDCQPVTGVRVIVHWTATSAMLDIADTLAVDSTGRFGTLARDVGADSIRLSIEASGDSPYFAASFVVPNARATEEEIRVLLVPRRWTIHRGRFAGATVSIDPANALRRVPGHGSFGRVAASRIVGWRPVSFPIPIVFQPYRGRSISSSDSIAFWQAARDVEEAIGGRFFVPWNDTTMHDGIFPVDVHIDPRTRGAGLAFVSYDREGNIFEGSIRFRESLEMHLPGVVEHELMHILGFGHTLAWPSAMDARPTTNRGVTADDVAYAQLLMTVREMERDGLVIGGLVEAGKR